MLTRRSAAALALMVCLAGCANNTSSSSASPDASAELPSSFPAASSPAAPTAEPGSAKPTAAGAETITGTVESGVEPNCLLLQDSKGSHLLVFDDAAMRADAAVGKKVTLSGRSEPTMMSTCQQGIPFIVTSVRPA
jgi:glucose/arabinose dehydrogenase